MKQLVKQSEYEIYISEVFDDNTLLEAMANLQQKVHRLEHCEPDFAEGRFHTKCYGYDGGIDLYYTIYRYETDSEFLAREDKEKKEVEAKKKRKIQKKEKALAKLVAQDTDFELYLKLKAKYQGEEL